MCVCVHTRARARVCVCVCSTCVVRARVCVWERERESKGENDFSNRKHCLSDLVKIFHDNFWHFDNLVERQKSVRSINVDKMCDDSTHALFRIHVIMYCAHQSSKELEFLFLLFFSLFFFYLCILVRGKFTFDKIDRKSVV